jgi:alpha-amylase
MKFNAWQRRILAAVAALIMIFATPATARAERQSKALTASLADEVVYHIFVRSFRDSNGDRQGDLNGISESIPYLQSLGVSAVLLTPLYPSRVYHNYFATDFTGIDPEFGTMDDFRQMVAKLHRADIKIYLDMEFQYVAQGHPWWTEAIADRKSPFDDFILWRDRAAGVAEDGPFNLRAFNHFGGTEEGVTTVALTAPKARIWFDRYMHDWVDPNRDGRFDDGVDGFRLDHMMDDLDNRGLLTNLFSDFWKPMFDRLRAINPDLTFIAEQADWNDYGGAYLSRADTSAIFAFPLHQALRRFDRDAIIVAAEQTGRITPEGKQQLIFAENHDVSRIASDPLITPEKLRTAAALTFFLKGTPILYYGQELGMRGATDAGYEDDRNAIPFREAFKWFATDASPTQALWYQRPGERFWDQRYARDHDAVSVEEQDAQPGSLLNRYRKLAELRRLHNALRTGSQSLRKEGESLLIIERAAGDERFLIVANLSPAPALYDGPGSDRPDLIGGGDGHLRAWQTALFKLSEEPNH